MSTKKTSSPRNKPQATKVEQGGLTVAHAAAAAPQTLSLHLAYASVPAVAVAVTPTSARPAASAPARAAAAKPAASAPAASSPVAKSVSAEQQPRASGPRIDSFERRTMIARLAYTRAQRLGLGQTDPLEDWLTAEREVDAMLARMAG